MASSKKLNVDDNRQIIYKTTVKQQLLVLLPFIGINAVTIIGYYLFFGNPIWNGSVGVSIVIICLNIIPVVLLNVQYLTKTFRTKLIIRPEDQTLQFFEREIVKEYSFSQVDRIEYFATNGHISKRRVSSFYTFDPYRYYRIWFKSGDCVFVTCLMRNDIENNFEQYMGIGADRIFKVLPFLSTKPL